MEISSLTSVVPVPARNRHAISIEHRVAGRIRVKIPRASGRRNLLQKYADVFSSAALVQAVTLNASTGCIVIQYRPSDQEEFFDCLAKLCDEEGLVFVSPAVVDPDEAARAVADRARLLAQHSEFALKTMTFFNDVDLELKIVSDNTIDLNIALVGGLAIFTFMGIGAAASTPMWVTLALYGINHAVRLQSQGLTAIPLAAPAVLTQ